LRRLACSQERISGAVGFWLADICVLEQLFSNNTLNENPRLPKRLAKPVHCGKTVDVDDESPVETTAAVLGSSRPVPLWRRLLIGGNVRWTLFRLLVLLTVSSIGKLHFFPDGKARYRRILVDGKSMNPTYENGQTLWMHTLEYTSLAPQRGDVVVFVLGIEGESPLYLKRIIGLPGDRIGIRRGKMTVNGNVYDDYGYGRIDARLRPLVLAEGEFFVMGDNRPISTGGVVEAGKVLGKIL
jgi:signal peptidase I